MILSSDSLWHDIIISYFLDPNAVGGRHLGYITFACSHCKSALSPLCLCDLPLEVTPELSHSWQLCIISSLPPNRLIIDRVGAS